MSLNDVRPIILKAIKDAENLRDRLEGLLADLDGGEAVQVPRQGRWTRQMLADMWRQVAHLSGIRALFEVTSEQPGESITFSTLIERSGLTEQQQRNEHARMSLVSAKLFNRKTWPIENWQGPRTPTGREEMLYRLDPTIAGWWRSIAD